MTGNWPRATVEAAARCPQRAVNESDEYDSTDTTGSLKCICLGHERHHASELNSSSSIYRLVRVSQSQPRTPRRPSRSTDAFKWKQANQKTVSRTRFEACASQVGSSAILPHQHWQSRQPSQRTPCGHQLLSQRKHSEDGEPKWAFQRRWQRGTFGLETRLLGPWRISGPGTRLQ